jgi:hypothetical protein
VLHQVNFGFYRHFGRFSTARFNR